MNFDTKLRQYKELKWMVDYVPLLLSWGVFIYFWVFRFQTAYFSLIRTIPVLVLSITIFWLGKKQVLFKLTGLRPQWIKKVVEAGVHLCPECGFPTEVTQKTNKEGTVTKIEESCGFCKFSSNITVIGSNEEYKDVSLIDNYTF